MMMMWIDVHYTQMRTAVVASQKTAATSVTVLESNEWSVPRVIMGNLR